MSGYQTGLFECFADMGVCMNVLICGFCGIPSGRNWAGASREECTCCHCLCQPHLVWTRADISKIRGEKDCQYLKDYFIYYCCTFCCCPCAVCQDGRELKAIGGGGSA
jgi:hypothetical protein